MRLQNTANFVCRRHVSLCCSDRSLHQNASGKSLLCHVQFLRELLDHGVLAAIVWLDTRDMLSDGLTKGAVQRDALLRLLDGLSRFLHEPKIWRPKVLSSQSKQ